MLESYQKHSGMKNNLDPMIIDTDDSKNTLHGYGVANILRIARKYDGTISYEKKEDMVVLSAMLQMSI